MADKITLEDLKPAVGATKGAKRVGMTTILTEHFSVKSKERREKIYHYRDDRQGFFLRGI